MSIVLALVLTIWIVFADQESRRKAREEKERLKHEKIAKKEADKEAKKKEKEEKRREKEETDEKVPVVCNLLRSIS